MSLRAPQKSLGSLALLILSLAYSSSWSASPLLIGESAAEAPNRPVGPRPFNFALALQLGSNVPINRPFRSTAGENFHFQVSRSLGVEFEMGWSPTLSFGLSSGWESFETRLDTSAGVNTEFQTASVGLIPLLLSVKYQFLRERWTPSVELGMGMGLYRFQLDSTNNSATADKESSASFLAQALVGARFFWTTDWTIDFHVGYRYTSVAKQSLNDGIQQAESRNFTGLYSRGGLSYLF